MNARHDAFAEQVRYLDSLGPRLTGSGAHGALVENVAEQLTGLGLTVHRDPHRFTRWNAPRDSTHLNLTVGDRPIRISSAYPYSGTTGPEGITAPVHLVTGGLRKNWAAAEGAIAVTEVLHHPFPYNLWIHEWEGPAARPELDNPVLSATRGFGRQVPGYCWTVHTVDVAGRDAVYRATALAGALLLVTVVGCSSPDAMPTATSSSRPGAAAPATVGPADWPTYHHDNSRSGVAPQMSPVGSALSLGWRAELDGAVYGQPLVIGNQVIAATENDTVYALSANDGQVVWSAGVGR